MTTGNRPRQKPDLELEKIDTDLLLFHPAQNKTCYCNETAALIWQLCNGERAPAGIGARIMVAYPEALVTIVARTQNTLRQFHEQGAIDHV